MVTYWYPLVYRLPLGLQSPRLSRGPRETLVYDSQVPVVAYVCGAQLVGGVNFDPVETVLVQRWVRVAGASSMTLGPLEKDAQPGKD
jgi:hypothetical protein